jgi:S-adenosylmethionine/arginine decarboxylase-like enzyme
VNDLGRVMNLQSYALVGRMDPATWAELLEEITEAIHMEAVDWPAQWSYPTEDSKGGEGMTMVLPITESFLALDTWPGHNGAYLLICSCRPFDTADIQRVLTGYNLRVTKGVAHTLRLEDG